jgi:hypothetical protein
MHLWDSSCRVPDTSSKLNIYMFLRELKWKSESYFQTWASWNEWCIPFVNLAHSSNWSGSWGPDFGLVCGELPVWEWAASASVPRGESHFFVNWYASYMPVTWQTVPLSAPFIIFSSFLKIYYFITLAVIQLLLYFRHILMTLSFNHLT